MNNIKFRAYDKIAHKFISSITAIYFDDTPHRVDMLSGMGEKASRDIGNIELSRSTGLKDKNGKEMYVGDYILYDDNETMNRWVSGEQALIIDYGYKIVARIEPYGKEIGINQNLLSPEFESSVTIIGNKWQGINEVEILKIESRQLKSKLRESD